MSQIHQIIDSQIKREPLLIIVIVHLHYSPGYYGKQIEEPSTWGYIILSTLHPLLAFTNLTACIRRLGQL